MDHCVGAALAEPADCERSDFSIRGNKVVFRRMVAGCPATVTVSVDSYEGVAVRMEPVGTSGDIKVFVELLHRDAGLTVTLAVSDSPDDVAQDWLGWARELRLPLLVIGPEGRIHRPRGGERNLGGVIAKDANERRKSSAVFRTRRSRNIRRRKPGHGERTERLASAEIIARS